MNQTVERHFSAYKGELSKLYSFKKDFLFLDLTLGDGGHTEEALDAGCRVVSFDVDPEAIKRAVSFLSPKYQPVIIESEDLASTVAPDFNWLIVRANFTQVGEILKKLNLSQFDGIMVDLGPSQFQVLSEGRGFSFATDEPLDMRLDKNLGVTAADLLAVLNEGELSELFTVADEPFAKPLARVIAKQRQTNPITTTKQLADLVSRVKKVRGHVHPATQVFMALRMAVNLERENIRLLLPQLPSLLKNGGLVGVISFHSGEDKMVKDFVNEAEEKNILSAINKKPIVPTTQELQISPRTRSAKLRIAKKIN
jgi:16S rRNA (cytosine1402-N4)-methyltransferase